MNGIEKITARLIRDAQVEVDAINAETDAQCAAIMAEYEAKAAEAYEKRIAKGVTLIFSRKVHTITGFMRVMLKPKRW